MVLSVKEIKNNLSKKLLSNLPKGYLEDYIKLFLVKNVDGTYSVKSVSSGTDTMKQMEQKYKEIIKTQYPKSRIEGEFLKGIRIRDINSAIKQDLENKNLIVNSLTDSNLKRGKRLDKTAKKTKYFRGSDSFPFHHIMPIGGETRLTTNDFAVITKQMNSRLSPYNTKLNNIADKISDNISKAYTTRSEGGSFSYLKKVDELNKEAENVIARVAEKLPKKYLPYIGFTQLTVPTDEYGLPLDDKLIKNRIGKVRKKGIPIDDLNSSQLKIFKNSIKSLTEKERVGYCRVITKLSNGGLPGNCAAAIDANPVKTATILDQTPVTSSAMAKVKNAASAFLKFAGKGKVFGATAAVGVGAGALVKEFRNDDPDTYLSNDKQANAMILDTIDEKERQDRMEAIGSAPELLGESAIGAELAATAAAIPGSKKLFDARKAKGFGAARAALGPVGKALSGFATPLGMAATTPLNVASQVYQGDSVEDIATNPLNYLGPAFAGTLTKEATRGMNPTGALSKALRLGMNPATIRAGSKFLGLPGLALSLGYEGYDQYKKYTEGRGFVYNLLNKND